MCVRDKEEVKGVWKSHFERLMNEKIERETIVSSVGVEAGGKCLTVHEESKESIRQLKCGQAAGVDRITEEILKYGGEAVVEWMCLICDLAWSTVWM